MSDLVKRGQVDATKKILRTRRAVPRYWNGRSLARARAAKHENKWEGIAVKIGASCKVGGGTWMRKMERATGG
jgi:hypothetical protein